MADDAVVPLPPEVWEKIAVFTRSKRSISCIGQLCHASHDGVTKSTRPWRAVEKKYGIRLVTDPARSRENTMKYVKERRVVKRSLESFARTGELVDGELPSSGTLSFWEGTFDYVKRDPDFYHACLMALFDKPVVDTVASRELTEMRSRCQLLGTPAVIEGALVLHTPHTFPHGRMHTPERDMAMLCAAYTAVCKPGVNLLLFHEDDPMSGMMFRFRMFLAAFDEQVVDGLALPNWVVHTQHLDGVDGVGNGWRIHLQNSSTILMCAVSELPPLDVQFDGIISCTPHAELPTAWMLAIEYQLPKHCVNFCIATRNGNDSVRHLE